MYKRYKKSKNKARSKLIMRNWVLLLFTNAKMSFTKVKSYNLSPNLLKKITKNLID